MYLALFLFLISGVVEAHQTSLTPSGKELFWATPQVPMVIGTNTSDLTANQIQTIIQESMGQWNQSSSAKIHSSSSSVNQIKFVANYPHGSAVLGMTELTYNAAGAIQSAVISLNDDYTFRGTPGFYPAGQVYLGDVVTHEIGHLFGMSHSEVLDSSMFYSSFSGQSTVSYDDKTGIRKKYDSGHGSISGYVKGGNNIGVLGAHVQAISRRTGEASGVISDETGHFSLEGLDLEDTYYLYISPIKNSSSLPGYFSNVQDEFCPGKYTGSFYSACGRDSDGRPNGIDVSYQQPSVDVGTVSISCSLRTNLDYDRSKNDGSNAVVDLWDFASDQSYEKSFVGWFRNKTTEWINPSWFNDTSNKWSPADKFNINLTGLNNPGGKVLKVALVSYPMGGQLEYEMEIFQYGTKLSGAGRKRELQALSETHKIDFSSYIELSHLNDANQFEVRLQAKMLTSTTSAATFPSLSLFSSETHLPYLLVASLWERSPEGFLQPILNNGQILSDNSSCLDAPYTYAVNRARSTESSTQSSTQPTTPGTSCGTIDPPDDGPGGQLPLIMMGFLLAMISSSLLKYSKKFLS